MNLKSLERIFERETRKIEDDAIFEDFKTRFMLLGEIEDSIEEAIDRRVIKTLGWLDKKILTDIVMDFMKKVFINEGIIMSFDEAIFFAAKELPYLKTTKL